MQSTELKHITRSTENVPRKVRGTCCVRHAEYGKQTRNVTQNREKHYAMTENTSHKVKKKRYM